MSGVLLSAPQLSLRRAVTRRGKLVIDGNRSRRRLISLARWAFPDVWSAFAGSHSTAVAVLTRWPDLRALGSARRCTLTGVVAAHTRAVSDVHAWVEAIRAAARAWTDFWDGHLDLDALAWEVAEQASGTPLLVRGQSKQASDVADASGWVRPSWRSLTSGAGTSLNYVRRLMCLRGRLAR